MKKYLLLLMLTSFCVVGCEKDDLDDMDNDHAKYDPDIDPKDFMNSKLITNEYFPLTPNKKYIYEGQGDEGFERVEETRLEKTKTILEIECRAVNFKSFVDGKLIEETEDWYAQANDGTVWYFGEAVDNYDENGNIADHEGSWQAGVNGALPGIIMLAEPKKGKKYREEFLEGEAEDEAQVVDTKAELTIAYGSFADCVVTKNWTRLEPGIVENKTYAPGIGLVQEVDVKADTHIDLIAIE